MANTDNETFQLLLVEIKKLNKNLESTSFAVNNLTMQLNSLNSENFGLNLLFQSDSGERLRNPKDSSPICIDSAAGGDTVTNTHGYINWNNSHKTLKQQHLVKITSIRRALEKLKSIVPKPDPVQQQYTNSHNRAITNGTTHQTINGFFTFMDSVIPVVEKESRFPLDAVYVDVNNNMIKKEMEFLNKLNVAPTDGVVDRFLKIVEKEMHTCGTFEKLHGLKWV